MNQFQNIFGSRLLIVIFIFITIVCTQVSYAQKKEQLEKKRTNIENEIKYANQLLKQTRKKKQTTLNQLIVFNNLIDKTQELISTYNSEIHYIDKQIYNKKNKINNLQNDLVQLKEDYAKMIFYAFKNKDYYSKLMYVFASDDFNQAYRRMKYLQQYSLYRQNQAKLILLKQNELENEIALLENFKFEKQDLLVRKEKEKKDISVKRKEKNTAVVSLQRKEKDIRKKIKQKQAAARRLNKEIESIIAKEIQNKTKSGNIPLTPEEKELSASFSTNKGKLPWPSLKGIVSSTFGVNNHPDIKGIKINNNGIDILTVEGSKARSVFNGVVTRVISIPTFHNVVIVQHGEFYTVYTNMDQVYVKMGQKVTTKQEIGVIYTSKADNKTELHFEIRKGTAHLNPLYWLATRN